MPWETDGWTKKKTVSPPSGGLITNFTPINSTLTGINGEWQLDGVTVGNVNANDGTKSWVLQMVDDHCLRFENRFGDHWPGDGAGSGNNRNECGITPTYAENVEMNMSFILTFLPGTVSTSGFIDLTQVHSITNSPPSPFYLGFDPGDYLNVVIQSPTVPYSQVWKASAPIVRGQPYDIKCQVLMKPAGGGYARVWVDDVLRANFSGAIGATGSGYWWKFGIYRDEVQETIAATFRNVTLRPFI